MASSFGIGSGPICDPAIVDGALSLLMKGIVIDPYTGEDLTVLVLEGVELLKQERIDAAFARQMLIRREWAKGARPTKEGGLRTTLALDPVLAAEISKDEGPEALGCETFAKDIIKFHPEFSVPEAKGPATITAGIDLRNR